MAPICRSAAIRSIVGTAAGRPIDIVRHPSRTRYRIRSPATDPSPAGRRGPAAQDAASGHERTYRSLGGGAGVREFVILTAQVNHAHLEALSTIRIATAAVVLLDVFALDFGPLLALPEPLAHGGEWILRSCCISPPSWSPEAPIQRGARIRHQGEGLYKFILEPTNGSYP